MPPDALGKKKNNKEFNNFVEGVNIQSIKK